MREYNKSDVCERIRNLRIEKKLTVEQLAELIDMHPNSVSNIQNGKVGMSSETLYSIAQALDVSLDFLVTGREKENIEIYDELHSIIELLNECKLKDLKKLEKMIRVFLEVCSESNE